MDSDSKKYICSVDIGTTFIRSQIFDVNTVVCGEAKREIVVIIPEQGAEEIVPEVLWNQFVTVIKDAINVAEVNPSEIAAIGISTQRNTFVTWDRDSGKCFHNFITWRDSRCDEFCKRWNNSFSFKLLNFGSKILYYLTRNSRFFAGSIFQLIPIMVATRLAWMIDINKRLREKLSERKVLFGCIETWLVWKITGGAVHATDTSLASTTGMWDPYIKDWGLSIVNLIGVPAHVLPDVLDTCSVFGCTEASLFGAEIPIAALIGDQQAATFGCQCVAAGSLRISISTGAFVDLNTGNKPHSSIYGLKPMVGWKIANDMPFLATAVSNSLGAGINWAKSIGLFDTFEEINDIVLSVKNSDGVYFIPAFSGIQTPVNDESACCCLIGLKQSSTKAHMLRAVMDSLAFTVYQIYLVMLKEIGPAIDAIRITGGVARNDFVCQTIANLLNSQIERPRNEETSSLGAAFLAGCTVGFWHREQLSEFVKIGDVFRPDESERLHLLNEYRYWLKAQRRSLDWYT